MKQQQKAGWFCLYWNRN